MIQLCPNCGRLYTPVLDFPAPSDTRLLQEIYPDSEPWQREQLLTGLCCDECWDKFLGE